MFGRTRALLQRSSQSVLGKCSRTLKAEFPPTQGIRLHVSKKKQESHFKFLFQNFPFMTVPNFVFYIPKCLYFFLISFWTIIPQKQNQKSQTKPKQKNPVTVSILHKELT